MAPPMRLEHPNPIFKRKQWQNLNGRWDFAIQPRKCKDPPEDWEGSIRVPFCLQAPLSGALDELSPKRLQQLNLRKPPLAPGLRKCDTLWYRRELAALPSSWQDEGMRVLLHVGACDTAAALRVNGHHLAVHRGGSTPFTHDITDALISRGNARTEILLSCTDGPEEGHIEPCGKQIACASAYSGEGPHVPTLYSNISGIWQTVWLEAVSRRGHLARVQTVAHAPKPGPGRAVWRLELRPELARGAAAGLRFEAALFKTRSLRGTPLASGRVRLGPGAPPALFLSVSDEDARPWSPEDPHLYGLRLRLLAGTLVVDEVESYAALRTVTIRGDVILLNGEPRYMRLVLDQGYYPDGLWTAPSVDALRLDITRAMGMGFNGVRLHQKVFEPLYFALADELGFMVISEYPDWAGGKSCRWEVTPEYRSVVAREWTEAVANLHNHPSIMAWSVFNEFGPKGGWRHNYGAGGGFWGRYKPNKRKRLIRAHTDFVRKVLRRVRLRDIQRRPVHDASGWIHVSTDVWSFHEYRQDPESFARVLADPPARHVEGRKGQPLLVAEYAGVGWDAGGPYGDRNPKRFLPGYPGKPGLPKDADEALERFRALTQQIYEAPQYAGYCCTQLYDVEYEKNGLLRYDRKPKFSMAALRRIFDGREQRERWALWAGARKTSGVKRSIQKR